MRTKNPELFFPTGPSRDVAAFERAAKRVCAACPVRRQCLDWAVETRQYTGVWGGLSEKERLGLYEEPESAFTRCLNEQEWIEQQLSEGASQKQIARTMRVGAGFVGRAIKQMRRERDALDVLDAAREGCAA